MLLDHIGLGALLADLDGRVVGVTAVAAAALGWSVDQLIGRPLTDLAILDGTVDPADLATGVSWRGMLGLNREDGGLLISDVVLTPLRQPWGEVVGVQAIGLSPGARAIALPSPAAALADAVDNVVIGLDTDARIVFANGAVERVLGWPAWSLLGIDGAALVHGWDEAHDETLRRVVAGEEQRGALRYRHLDGSTRLLSGVGRRHAEDDPMGPVVLVLQDKSVEEALGDTLRIQADIIENADDAVFTIDRDGTVSGWSAGAERLYGWSAEEALGRPFTFVVPEPLWPEAADLCDRVVRGERVHGHRTEWVTRGGEGVRISLNLVPAGRGRRLRGITAIARDVTGEDTAWQALRASEARFRALVQRSADVAVVVDADACITYVSPAVEERFGYTADELESRLGFDFIHPDDVAAVAEEFAAVAAVPGATRTLHFRARHGDGHWMQIEETLTNLLDEPAVAGIVANLRDVTERHDALEAVRDSEERYRSIVENALEGIWHVDRHGTTVFANARMAELLATTVDELLGSPMARWLLETPAEIEGRLARRAAGQRDQREVRLRTATGEELWALLSGSPLHDAAGNVCGSLGLVTDITERKRAEDELAHLALHDPLTGLPNRTLLIDRLDHAMRRADRRGATVGVLFVDLDHFKVVNDSLGHAAGDDLLREVAVRLGGAVRSTDTVARFGGDEFVVLCEDETGGAGAFRVADAILTALRRPITVGDTEVLATASVGVALATTGTADEVVRAADAAMYRAKDDGRDRYALFDAGLHAAALERLRVRSDLHRAVADGEFVAHYQPVVDIQTGRVRSFEALARWHHRERGVLAPGEFIAVAEETSLIVDIGRLMLRQACVQTAAWRSAGHDVTVSVNLSARQLCDGLVETVRDALVDAGLEPGALMLEVTESVVMVDPERALRTLNAVRQLGVRLAVDDFGTGYSSLSYLKRYPFDVVKIDRSFVDGLAHPGDDGAIVAGIIGLCHSLGLTVVAEGVEVAGQHAELRSLECELGQGYLWSRPLTADEVAHRVLDPANECPDGKPLRRSAGQRRRHHERSRPEH